MEDKYAQTLAVLFLSNTEKENLNFSVLALKKFYKILQKFY